MVYVFLAEGFEEIEALTAVDILRRGNIPVLTVGVSGAYVTGSHDITVKADISVDEVDLTQITGVVLPGGMPGTENLLNNETVRNTALFAFNNNILVSAICAAPLILGRLGILNEKKATCYPGFEKELTGAVCTGERVVIDGNVITSKGAGTSLDFALDILAFLAGSDIAGRIGESVQR